MRDNFEKRGFTMKKAMLLLLCFVFVIGMVTSCGQEQQQTSISSSTFSGSSTEPTSDYTDNKSSSDLYPKFSDIQSGLNNNQNEDKEPIFIYGVKIFNSDDDLTFLTHGKGFGPFNDIQEVHEAIGKPISTKTEYSEKLNNAPYQEDIIYEEYDFCNIIYAENFVYNITIKQQGFKLMRGISIGDNYEKILKAFPKNPDYVKPHDEYPIVILYEIDGDFRREGYTDMLENGNGRITYIDGKLCIEFIIENGVLVEFSTGYIF